MVVYLYVKVHKITGLKYFGKTVQDPYKYRGSGKYWLRHLSKHGNHVDTIKVWEFMDIDSASRFAIRFSRYNQIVESQQWANLIIEDALYGKPKGERGHDFTPEQRMVLSKISKERWSNDRYKDKMIAIHKQRFVDNPNMREVISKNSKLMWTEEKRMEHSNKLKGRPSKLRGIKRPPITDSHRNNLSKATLGKAKTPEHREKLALRRIKMFNPEFKFDTYADFVREVLSLYDSGKTVKSIQSQLSAGATAIYKVINLHRK